MNMLNDLNILMELISNPLMGLKLILMATVYICIFIMYEFYLPLTLILFLIGMIFNILNMQIIKKRCFTIGIIILIIGLILNIISLTFKIKL